MHTQITITKQSMPLLTLFAVKVGRSGEIVFAEEESAVAFGSLFNELLNKPTPVHIQEIIKLRRSMPR